MQLSSVTPVTGSKTTDSRSEKNLAVAILRQAWQEAVIDLRNVRKGSRDDYRFLKEKAIEWISSDEEGFHYWCKLADLNQQLIRQNLSSTLKRQRRNGRA